MTFFLGTHQAGWLGQVTIPLFVSRRRLQDRRRLPRATCDWALDSGGFSELSRSGAWTIGPEEYAAQVRRYQQEIGRLLWAATQDWMVEPAMLERTGLTIAEHQRRTTENFLTLSELAPAVPWVPTLQGWHVEDYLRHWEQYEQAGVALERQPLVGLGSVCRRQHMVATERIVRALSSLRLHGYGFKLSGIERCGDVLVSSDSLAWSLDARRRPPLPGCPHRSCANCLRWAIRWRRRVLERLTVSLSIPRQQVLAL